jgi:hypothetical protein
MGSMKFLNRRVPRLPDVFGANLLSLKSGKTLAYRHDLLSSVIHAGTFMYAVDWFRCGEILDEDNAVMWPLKQFYYWYTNDDISAERAKELEEALSASLLFVRPLINEEGDIE